MANFTMTTSGSGVATYCTVVYNGTQYYTSGQTFSVTEGTTVYCHANYSAGDNKILLNGTPVSAPASGEATYSYTPVANATITFSCSPGDHAYIIITEEEIETKTITITNTGVQGYCHVVYNGTSYYSPGSFTYTTGTITCYAYYSSSGNKIIINGVEVSAPSSGAAQYSYTPSADATVSFEYSPDSYSRVIITEAGATKTCSVTYNGSAITSFETSDSVHVVYGGNTIALFDSGSKTLQCSGKVMSSNVSVSDGTTNKMLQCNGKLMASNITITLSGSSWENPVKDGDALNITQVKVISRESDILDLE